MGNTKSSSQGSATSSSSSSIKRQPRLELPDETVAPNARHGSPRKVSRASNSPRPSVSSQGRRISALPLSHRQIVKGCMDKSKDDIAERIYRRIYEKRDDFRNFFEALSDEKRYELTDSLRSYLRNVVDQITDGAAVQRISEDFGARHVQYRSAGFRPDFFALTADAVTTECVLLDAAVHQASDALFAWSTLTSLMFSSVRDGYYSEQRRIRKASQGNAYRARLSTSDITFETGKEVAEDEISYKERDHSCSPSPYSRSREQADYESAEMEVPPIGSGLGESVPNEESLMPESEAQVKAVTLEPEEDVMESANVLGTEAKEVAKQPVDFLEIPIIEGEESAVSDDSVPLSEDNDATDLTSRSTSIISRPIHYLHPPEEYQ